jgi:hypothetical protein
METTQKAEAVVADPAATARQASASASSAVLNSLTYKAV